MPAGAFSIGMALTLRLRSGDVDPVPELPFDAPRVVVGRGAGCDLQLPDPSVSLRHASLRQRGSEYVIVDEGSENGTFLGSTRLTKHAPHPVASGDLLRFGRVWVEVRLGPADHPIEVQASRELARRLVDAALEADAKPNGMIVSVEGTELSLRLAEPRRPYLVGGKKGADLRITDLPSRCLELRRQADQLWVTLLGKTEATFGERALLEGERAAWPKAATLSVGDVRLVVSDPTARVLEQLERGRTERMADGAAIDPPSRDDADEEGDDADDDAPEQDDEDWTDDDASGDDAEHDTGGSDDAAPLASGTPPRAKPARGSWSRGDAIVFFLAIGVLALSLWAIRWLAQLGSA
jgi:pSer/pThr/pTyr-binding forkhead associated (FHA) protein